MKKRIPRLENPYRRRGRWFKGAFHFHSTNSDGALPPYQAIAKYVSLGYQVLGLSDHNFVSRVPASWFPGTVLIPTAEISSPHLLHIGANTVGRLVFEKTPQALARIKREGGFSVLNHPGWSNCTWNDLSRVWPVNALEIYNHLTEMENAVGLAVERWDMLLQTGRRYWGFASDDAHFNRTFPQCDGGWVRIRAPRLTQPEILRSLHAGSFYSSSGPRLFDLRVARGTITLRCSPVVEVRAIADGVGSGGVQFAQRPRGRWVIQYQTWGCQPKRYVRIELRDAKGRTAWTNPLFVTP